MSELSSISLRFIAGQLEILDQQALPHQETWVNATDPEMMIDCIKALKVRGAPLIGVAAGLALACYAQTGASPEAIQTMGLRLRAARPTAVNLMWAIDRLLRLKQAPQTLLQEAFKIFEEDVALCQRMGENGAALIEDGDHILHHCNTGGLATVGIGTALGVIKTAWDQGKHIHVYVDETRPLLQGGRLTTWELEQYGIPYTLIADNMAAMLMAQKRITKVFLGADRVAMNGDFANKIGTYSVAVNARYHAIPFYPVAPYSTWDGACPTGAEIPIEERPPQEVRGLYTGDICWSPTQAPVYNPAFDVTPVSLVTALVSDRGVFSQTELQNGILKRHLSAE